jgi:Zn-dependent peptidase ImmA (M78 family)
LKLRPSDPLDPSRLASHLGIRIWSPHDIPGLDENCLRILLKEDPDSWSAFTLTVNSARLIIINTAHSPSRQRSDIMHEIAHILIGHEAAKVFVSPDGLLLLNTFKKTQEDEANWLAGCLLLPREALVMIRRQRLSDDETKAQYGVTNDMLTYRVRNR